MSTRCPLCTSPVHRRFRIRGFDVVRCDRCDLEFVDPMPSEAELVEVYAKGYFTGGGHGYADYFGRERVDADEKARARVEQLAKLGARPGGRWLDVGCADGRFLLEAARQGFHVAGVEPSTEARDRANAVLPGRVFAQLDEAAALGPFDVVTFWDVLEHLPDPLGVLRHAATMMSPGALVGVVVPVIDNLNARLAPRSWDQYKPPEHLWFFSRRSIRALLERALDAEPVFEASAWRRGARAFLPRLEDRAGRRYAGKFEAALWNRLRRAGMVPAKWFDDSVLVVFRRRTL